MTGLLPGASRWPRPGGSSWRLSARPGSLRQVAAMAAVQVVVQVAGGVVADRPVTLDLPLRRDAPARRGRRRRTRPAAPGSPVPAAFPGSPGGAPRGRAGMAGTASRAGRGVTSGAASGSALGNGCGLGDRLRDRAVLYRPRERRRVQHHPAQARSRLGRGQDEPQPVQQDDPGEPAPRRAPAGPARSRRSLRRCPGRAGGSPPPSGRCTPRTPPGGITYTATERNEDTSAAR